MKKKKNSQVLRKIIKMRQQTWKLTITIKTLICTKLMMKPW